MSSAEVIDLQEWRDWHVVRNARRRAPISHGWHDLAWIGQTDRRDAIRIYARLGLHPILLHGVTEAGGCTCGRDCAAAAGKHPVHRAWQTAALDVEAIDAALVKNWRLNIGLRMGLQPCGRVIIAIDVDGDRSLLDPLEARLGPLPPTLTATSGKGLHLLYWLRDGARAPKNRVRMADGVDVRSEGGQVVAAPSKHASGRRYQWLDVREPAVLP